MLPQDLNVTQFVKDCILNSNFRKIFKHSLGKSSSNIQDFLKATHALFPSRQYFENLVNYWPSWSEFSKDSVVGFMMDSHKKKKKKS